MAAHNTRPDTEVTQDSRNYYIRIAARDRERAKRIPGRRWDPERVKWVCPKTPAAYAAIMREFQRPDDGLAGIEPPAAAANPSPPPAAAAKPPPPPADSAGSGPPEWAARLSGLPDDLEGLKIQAAAGAETLGRVLKTQQAVLDRLAAPESPPEPPEPDDAAAFPAICAVSRPPPPKAMRPSSHSHTPSTLPQRRSIASARPITASKPPCANSPARRTARSISRSSYAPPSSRDIGPNAG